MKVKDYLPLYGQLYETNYGITINGQVIGIIELFDNHKEYELNNFQINELEMFDRFGLQKHLEHEFFTPQTVTVFMRELFDNYRNNEGDPMYWINRTLDAMLLNPESYKPELRTIIEKTLLDLKEVFSKVKIPGFKEFYLKVNSSTQKKEPLSLEDIFTSKTDLNKLVNLLKEKNFVTIENGSLKWTGIESKKASGIGYQLVALSEVCRPLYKRTKYQAKELNKAWTTYFNYEMKVIKWQPGERPADGSVYHQLFRNILHSFSV